MLRFLVTGVLFHICINRFALAFSSNETVYEFDLYIDNNSSSEQNETNERIAEDFLLPAVELLEARFYTNDSQQKLPSSTYPLEYLLPITFQSLTFRCISNYVTFWKFESPPHCDRTLKDFFITKVRYAEDMRYDSTYKYVSDLTLNFKDPGTFPKIFCVRKTSGMAIIESQASDDVFRIKVTIRQKYGEIPHFPEKRLGENRYSNITLHINKEDKRFRCGKGSYPQIIPCNNPDECNAVLTLDDQGESHRLDNMTTFFIDNTTCKHHGDGCVQLSPSFSPAVIACRDKFGNSIARRYLITYPKKGSNGQTPILRLGRDKTSEEETIEITVPTNEVYYGQSVKVTCTGAGAYYSYGFKWGIQMENDTMVTVCNKSEIVETFDAKFHRYNVENTLHFNKSMGSRVTVYCYGPRWNKIEWVSCSKDIKIKEPQAPKIITANTTLLATTSNRELHVFRCNATGKPLPNVTWQWNFKPIAEDFLGDFYNVTNSTDGDSHVESYLTAYAWQGQPNNTFQCRATNFLGSVDHKFHVRVRSSLQMIATITGWSSLSITLIFSIGGVAGGLFLLIIVCFIRNHYRKKLQILSDEDIRDFEQGDLKAESCALMLPYSMEYEISSDELIIQDILLGEGQFGQVYKGLYQARAVAIKTLKKTAEVRYFKAILAEIKIMSYVGRHEHLVNMVGACTRNLKQREIHLVTEFCENGSLVKFLKSIRGIFKDLLNPEPKVKFDNEFRLIDIDEKSDSLNVLPCITSQHLTTWAADIASGMEYLGSKKVVHGDLAARNILLSDTLVAKVGDFGLSKQLSEDYALYVQKMECPLPLKWLAIESLRDFEFSMQSDIWAYGITLWEIFSLGATPYPGIPQWNFQSYTLLKSGYRMEKPSFSNDAIYNIMRACWNEAPKARPSFPKLKEYFTNWTLTLQPNSYA